MFDQGIAAVLDLDPGNIRFGDRIAHRDAVRLAHIDAGIGCPGDLHTVDQYPGAFDGINAVCAVFRVWAARPCDADAVIDDVVGALGLDTVALGVLQREIAQGYVVAGDQQPFARTLLAGEIENRAVHSRTADGDIVDIEAEAIGDGIAARRKDDLVARLGKDQRLLQGLLSVFARGRHYASRRMRALHRRAMQRQAAV